MRVNTRWPQVLALVGLAAWLITAIATWASAAPLGHDESQYAIAAREALAGEPARWFYLSRGMNALAIPGIWLGGTELALRFVPLLFGVGFVGATWLLARRVVGPVSAAWAVLVLAGMRSVVRLGSDLLSDVPASACLLAAFALFVDEVDRPDGPRWRLVFAAPLLAAAMYIRYGSAVPILVIVVASLAVGARSLARRPLPVIVTAVAFLVLLVPHFLSAHAATGSPLGILLASREVPQQYYFAEGVVTYVTSNPIKYYGLLAPIVFVAGLAAIRIADKRKLLAWLVGVGNLIAMGITTHAQPRYVFVTIAILIVLGVDQLRQLAVRLPKPRVVAIVALVVLLAIWAQLLRRQLRADEGRIAGMRGTIAASAVIKADAGGAPCMLIGYHYTQLEWYSDCEAPLLMSPAAASEGLAAGQRVYVVRDYGKTWAPAPQPVFEDMPGTKQVLLSRPGVVDVVRLAP